MGPSRDIKSDNLRDLKKEENALLTIDTNAPDCIFKLPLLAALMEAEDGKIQVVEVMLEETKKLFDRAREGQGFATTEIVFKDLKKDQWVKETSLIPAFEIGGSLKQDKEGKRYQIGLEAVTSAARVGQSGSGVIHTEARLVSLIIKELAKRKDKEQIIQQHLKQCKVIRTRQLIKSLSVSNDISGCVIGGAIVKGAESHDENNYKIHILTQKDSVFISNIRQSFPRSPTKYEDEDSDIAEIKLDSSLLNKYTMQAPKEGHLFLVPNDEKKAYEIYYIRDGKFIYSATKENISEIPQNQISTLIKKTGDEKTVEYVSFDKKLIIQKCFNALTLSNPFTINNKSASQNGSSIFYDPDFESFIMYLNPERYLLDDKKQIMPEGRQWGSYFDLHRSAPMILSDALRDQLIKNFNIQDEDIIIAIKKQQQDKCSSWDIEKYPYHEVIQNYYTANIEEKLQIYSNNIHIALRLYEKTLLMYKNNEPIWGRKWDKAEVKDYLNVLQSHLSQLLISHHKLSKELDFDTEWKSKPSTLFENDKRNLSQVLESLKTLAKVEDSLTGPEDKQIKKKSLYDICHASLDQLRSPYRQNMETHIQFLCSSEPISHLLECEKLLKNASLVCSDDKETKALLKTMLTEISVNSLSALENVIKEESYQAAVVILFYGGINAEILKKVSIILINRIQKESIVQKDPVPGDIKREEKRLVLDDFLRSFVRQVHRQHLSIPPTLSKIIVDHSGLFPKTVDTLKQLAPESKGAPEDEAMIQISDPLRHSIKSG